MNLKSCLVGIATAACFGVLSACSTSNTEDSLTLPDSYPQSVSPGDTTDVIAAVKKARDATGRLQTDNAYTEFYLVSGDTSIAKIVQERRVLGVGVGNTTITAKDKQSSLSSPQYSFTVAKIL